MRNVFSLLHNFFLAPWQMFQFLPEKLVNGLFADVLTTIYLNHHFHCVPWIYEWFFGKTFFELELVMPSQRWKIIYLCPYMRVRTNQWVCVCSAIGLKLTRIRRKFSMNARIIINRFHWTHTKRRLYAEMYNSLPEWERDTQTFWAQNANYEHGENQIYK